MRFRAGFFTGCFCILFCQWLSAQTIQLNVNESGNASISVNGQALRFEEMKTLVIPAGSGIRFDFSNIKDRTTLFRLIGALQDDTTEIELDSSYFNVATTLSTDNMLNVQAGRKKVNINRPFVVLLGSRRTGRTAKVTILPQLAAATTTPVTVGGPANAISTSSNNAGAAEAGEEPYLPGSVVYDALKLSDNEKLSEEEFRRIIQYYFPDQVVDDIESAKTIAATNPFLKGKWIIFNPLKPDKEGIAQSGGQLLSALSFSSIGGLDVTNLADGIAKFLVKRTKQELSIAFFKKFKETIDGNADLKVLFPLTVKLLMAIEEEVYNYERYIQNLREAFKDDIATIHHNLPGIIPVHPQHFSDHPVQKAVLLTSCYIAVELENQTHAGDILANYPVEYLDSLGDTKDSAGHNNVRGAIQTIQLLSASLRDTTSGEDGNYWVNIDKVREVVNSRPALKIYMGLLYQEAINRYQRVQFDRTNLVELLDTVAAKWDTAFTVYDFYKRYILRFGDKVTTLNKMIREYSKPATDSAAVELYAKYFRTVVDLVEYSSEASRLPVINKAIPDLEKLLRKYFDVAYETVDLVTDVTRKNYSSAINHAVTIYNLVRVKPLQESLAAGNTTPIPASLSSAKSTLHDLARYGSFMAAVATAKNSDEVAEAIETAALPVGSSSIKRETSFNVALNAYVGPYIGFERIKGVESKKLNGYGITAPIGVSISRGRSILFIPVQNHTSSTIFFSLIDLGAVTAFRFTNDSAEKVPTIELKDIVAPGIFYSHGFGKTPLSFNIGYQFGPLLRRVNLDDNLYEKKYSRFSFSLTVDIPVFNLYARTK